MELDGKPIVFSGGNVKLKKRSNKGTRGIGIPKEISDSISDAPTSTSSSDLQRNLDAAKALNIVEVDRPEDDRLHCLFDSESPPTTNSSPDSENASSKFRIQLPSRSKERPQEHFAADDHPASPYTCNPCLPHDVGEGSRHMLWSPGAELHYLGQCSPCAHFHGNVGCTNERNCTFCHLCPRGELLERRRRRRKEEREIKKANAAAAEADAATAASSSAQQKGQTRPRGNPQAWQNRATGHQAPRNPHKFSL